jgi:hypothetical protein
MKQGYGAEPHCQSRPLNHGNVELFVPCCCCPASLPIMECATIATHSQGVKKTKLGLREFIQLGDFMQIINTHTRSAVSVATKASAAWS